MSTESATKSTLQGPVLEVLGALLSEQRNDEVLALVAKLVQRNGELAVRAFADHGSSPPLSLIGTGTREAHGQSSCSLWVLALMPVPFARR